MPRDPLHAAGVMQRHLGACPCLAVYASLTGLEFGTLTGSSPDLCLALQPLDQPSLFLVGVTADPGGPLYRCASWGCEMGLH